MFELLFLIVFIAFMVVFLMLCKKLRAHFDKVQEQNHQIVLALVNLDKQLENIGHNLIVGGNE